MKKRIISFIAIMLSLTLVFASVSTVYAEDEFSQKSISSTTKTMVTFAGNAIDAVVGGITNIFPKKALTYEKDYVTENFFEGTKTFQKEQSETAQWKVGYGSESIVPDDLATRGYTLAGEFHITDSPVYDILDGDTQAVRVVAMNDSTGNGTVVFASIDGFGMSSTNIRKIRSRLMEYAKENNIVSINVSLSHSHSCIDTHGLGKSILALIGESFISGFANLFGFKYEVSSTDNAFMNNLFSKAEKAIKTACSSMTAGTIQFSSYDLSDMINDKQLPSVYYKTVNQIKFVPNDTRKNEIWLVNAGIHPVKMNGNNVVSSDFPGAIVRYAKEMANADVAFYQGAELAITRNENSLHLENDETFNSLTGAEKEFYAVNAYGKEIVTRMMGTPVQSFAVEPILNIKHTEFKLSVDNSFLRLACKINLINNMALNTTGKLKDIKIVSETGYCELGKKLAIALIPGELDPEIAIGSTRSADESWNGTNWNYPTYEDVVGKDKTLLVFGLTNDQIGYIIPDNDFAHTFASLFEDKIGGSQNKHYEELISLGGKTASTLTDSFISLVNSTK